MQESILQLNNVNRYFGGIKAVNDVTVDIYKYHVNAIIGPNGAGKTTLFNVITGYYPVTSGNILFENNNITNMPPYKLVNYGIARTFQLNTLFMGLSAFENIRLAKQYSMGYQKKFFSNKNTLNELNQKTEEILKTINLFNQRFTLARLLSYGDQRALEIGLALASDPKLLLLDEPTAGMSKAESTSIVELIKNQKENLSIILVEHDIDLVLDISDNIIVMNQGTIIASGNPDEVQNNQDVQDAYLGGGQ